VDVEIALISRIKDNKIFLPRPPFIAYDDHQADMWAEGQLSQALFTDRDAPKAFPEETSVLLVLFLRHTRDNAKDIVDVFDGDETLVHIVGSWFAGCNKDRVGFVRLPVCSIVRRAHEIAYFGFAGNEADVEDGP
jgi:hypothetical protein